MIKDVDWNNERGECVNDECWICFSHHVIGYVVLSKNSQFQCLIRTKFSSLPSLSGSQAEVPPTCFWDTCSHATGREAVVNHRMVHFTQDMAYITSAGISLAKASQRAQLNMKGRTLKTKRKIERWLSISISS